MIGRKTGTRVCVSAVLVMVFDSLVSCPYRGDGVIDLLCIYRVRLFSYANGQ